VNGAIASRGSAQFVSSQDGNRRVARQSLQLSPTAGRAVDRRNNNSIPPGLKPLTGLFVSYDRLAGSPRKSNEAQAATHQGTLDLIDKIVRHTYRPSRRFRKHVLRARLHKHITIRTQPKSPPRKALRHIGDNLAVRTDDKPNHLVLWSDGAGHDTAAHRPALRIAPTV
jgi:hypothetical protein